MSTKNKLLSASLGVLLLAFMLGFACHIYSKPTNIEPKTIYVLPEGKTATRGIVTQARVANVDTVSANPKSQTIKREPIEIVSMFTGEVVPIDEQDKIGEVKEVSDVAPFEPTPLTVGEIMKSNGMSDSDIEMMNSIFPVTLNPNMDITSQEFIDQVTKLGEWIERDMRATFEDTTLEEGKVLVDLMKNDPTMPAEDFRIITEDYFPQHLQDALRKEGLLQ